VESRTHLAIDGRLCGTALELDEGRAQVGFVATSDMAADDRGLVHGGFVFGLADYAAMLAVNHENVVLGSAETRFLRPVRVGEELIAEARIEGRERKKILVSASVRRGDEVVLEASFVCFTPATHILEVQS
jgi:uncharacterized protein (TIGR00369 family)